MTGIYLDHNATTKPLPEVLAAMADCPFGNPSSLHGFGQEARRVLDAARASVGALLGAEAGEILFTSGGTESDNHALLGLASGTPSPAHIAVSAIEHSAILDTCRFLEEHGWRISYIPVDSEGILNPSALDAALATDTVLVSVMLANNDVGTIQPLREVVARARMRGIPVHTDAVQAAGKIPIDVCELGVDLLSVSAHKLHGPKGVGALFVRRGFELPALVHGGPQEGRRRAGTENVPSIAGFGRACEIAQERLGSRARQDQALRDRLEHAILDSIPGTRLNGHPTLRLPNTLNVSFEGLVAEDLQLNLDLAGIAVSTGAACSSAARKPSHVLQAMGRTEREALSALRFSFGEGNTESDVARTLDALRTAVRRLRNGS